MPMYDYKCSHCGNRFEELVFSSSVPDEDIVCPECGQQEAIRQLSAPNISTGSSVSTSAPACPAGAGFS